MEYLHRRAGEFKNIHTGKFSAVLLIRSTGDLKEFLEDYDISEADV